MDDHRRRVFEVAIAHWRAERDSVRDGIARYRDGLLRIQRKTAEGWVDVTAEELDVHDARLASLEEDIAALEQLLE